tara:strand:+ start:689 stop:1009 length:321 start_codon:yes stop_codon:yes gene_type:complete
MILRSKIGFRKFAKELYAEIPIIVSISYGVDIAVKKEFIKSFFIKKLLDTLSKHKNPFEGNYLERLWCYMFTKKSFKKSILDVIKTKHKRFKLNFSKKFEKYLYEI